MAHDRLSIINHFDGDLVLGPNEVVAAVRDLFAHRGDTMYDPQVGSPLPPLVHVYAIVFACGGGGGGGG